MPTLPNGQLPKWFPKGTDPQLIVTQWSAWLELAIGRRAERPVPIPLPNNPVSTRHTMQHRSHTGTGVLALEGQSSEDSFAQANPECNHPECNSPLVVTQTDVTPEILGEHHAAAPPSKPAPLMDITTRITNLQQEPMGNATHTAPAPTLEEQQEDHLRCDGVEQQNPSDGEVEWAEVLEHDLGELWDTELLAGNAELLARLPGKDGAKRRCRLQSRYQDIKPGVDLNDLGTLFMNLMIVKTRSG